MALQFLMWGELVATCFLEWSGGGKVINSDLDAIILRSLLDMCQVDRWVYLKGEAMGGDINLEVIIIY